MCYKTGKSFSPSGKLVFHLFASLAEFEAVKAQSFFPSQRRLVLREPTPRKSGGGNSHPEHLSFSGKKLLRTDNECCNLLALHRISEKVRDSLAIRGNFRTL